MTTSSAGLVVLHDLYSFRWHPSLRVSAFLDALGLGAGTPIARSERPPRSLVVCYPAGSELLLADKREWLARARELLLVVDFSGAREWSDDSWREAVRGELAETRRANGLENVSGVIEWDGVTPCPQVRRWLDERRGSVGDPPPAPAMLTREWDVTGRWIDLPAGVGAVTSRLVSSLCVPGKAPALFDPRQGGFVDLLSGAFQAICDPRPELTSWAVDVDGTFLLSASCEGEGWGRRYFLESREIRSGQGRVLPTTRLFRPRGFEPFGRFAFSGNRCVFEWLVCFEDGAVSPLALCEHDWPCGHAKKLYGYDDNEPSWLHLSREADAYLSVFDHDAIISRGVPLAWQDTDGIAVASWPASPDPLRSLFYVRRPGGPSEHAPDLLEEDARDAAPTIVLGPNDSFRYVLDTSEQVVRLRGDAATELDLTPGSFRVYDASHEAVREAPGKVLGGWLENIVVQHDGRFWREEVTTGRRNALGVAEPFDFAVPFAGTAHVLLVRVEPGSLRVRLL